MAPPPASICFADASLADVHLFFCVLTATQVWTRQSWPEVFCHRRNTRRLAKAFKDSHPTWPWALGLSGSTLAGGFVLIRITLHSAERDLDALRIETNELVKSSIKQGLQLEQIIATLADIKKKLG